jgi:hypothetical protein
LSGALIQSPFALLSCVNKRVFSHLQAFILLRYIALINIGHITGSLPAIPLG